MQLADMYHNSEGILGMHFQSGEGQIIWRHVPDDGNPNSHRRQKR